MKYFIAISLCLLTSCTLKKNLSDPIVNESDLIEQSIYQVKWKSNNKTISFKAILHRKGESMVSIAVIKSGTRALTIWKKEEIVWVYLPREKKVFVGSADTPMVMFRGWPVYSVDEWISLFLGEDPSVEELSPGVFTLHPGENRILQWKLKKKQIRPRVAKIVFEPTFQPATTRHPLEELNAIMEHQEK